MGKVEQTTQTEKELTAGRRSEPVHLQEEKGAARANNYNNNNIIGRQNVNVTHTLNHNRWSIRPRTRSAPRGTSLVRCEVPYLQLPCSLDM